MAVAVLSGVAFTFLELSKTDSERATPWQLVPENAAMVWENNELPGTWQRISTTNLIWANLQKAPFFSDLDSSMASIQKHFEADEKWQADLAESQMLVSAHMINGVEFDFLFLFELPETIKAAEGDAYLKTHLSKAVNAATLQEQEFGAGKMFLLKEAEHTWHFAQLQGVVLVSSSLALLKEANAQFTSGHAINVEPAFQKVSRSAGTGKDGSIYIRSTQFEKVLGTFLHPDHKNDAALPGNWIELDVNIRPNKVDLAGMIDTATHRNALLQAAMGQASGKTHIAEFAPLNTAALYSIALTDAPALLTALESSGERDPEMVQDYSDSLDIDLDKAMLSWMDIELGRLIVHDEGQTKSAFVIGTSSESKAEQELGELGYRMDLFLEEADEPRPAVIYRDVAIKKLALTGLFEKVLGEQFKDLIEPFYIVMNDHVVLSDDLGLMRNIINGVLDRNTLASDLGFRDLNANASEQNSLYGYVSLPRYRQLLAELLDEENAARSEEWAEVWNDMGALVVQLSATNNGMAFINMTMRHQPAQLEESNTLWEARLDAPLAMKPQLLVDHNSGALDIFVQDEALNIYLFSNTGKALWRAELSGKILGDVHQVDRYKNGKLQMLFNTADKVFLVDRNGKNVEGFPIDLPANATAPLAVFDYDKDRSYRILVPCADNELRMYDIGGKAIKGWKSKRSEAPVTTAPVHIRIRSKDYIYCFDTLGNQHVLDRQGKSRYTAKAKLPLPVPTDPIIASNTEIGSTKLHFVQNGLLTAWTIDGTLDTLRPAVEEMVLNMTLADVAGSGEREPVFTTENTLVLQVGSKVILNEVFTAPIVFGPARFNFNDGDKVGVATQSGDGVWLFDAQAGALPDMPLKGSTAFSIGDLNRDGQFELVVGSGSGPLLVHQLK